ncbi:radical SAM protein [Methanospirillum hungatei]|uniref:radical SAM protein n=1 Tax=Methanospirillum hungatei TaxID=2203 RepID=UPI0026EAD232|nr:radical SAM protein [Methanospirillum hungatei]MCA1916240.1 radical SAM protein [Methanospirillum hungatei]
MTSCENQMISEQKEINLPEGVPPLFFFFLYLTSGCNLRCKHCWIDPSYASDNQVHGAYIPLNLLKKAVQEAKELGLCGAKLTGGEPMLHPQFQDVVSYLHSEGLRLSMETNGTLITPELAQFMKEGDKVDFITISLDSPVPDIHDQFRGKKGAFQKALDGLDALVEAGYTNCQVIMAVHKNNRDQMADLVKLATEHGAASVKFNPFIKSGRGIQMNERGETLNLTDILELSEYISKTLRPSSTISLIFLTPLALTSLSDLRVRKGYVGDCGVLNVLGILGTGEIALCGIGQTIPELVYGKLGIDSIKDIWMNNPIIQTLRKDLENVYEYPGICGSCIHAKQCRTGCVAHNYLENGILVSPQWECREAENMGIFPKTRLRSFPSTNLKNPS